MNNNNLHTILKDEIDTSYIDCYKNFENNSINFNSYLDSFNNIELINDNINSIKLNSSYSNCRNIITYIFKYNNKTIVKTFIKSNSLSKIYNLSLEISKEYLSSILIEIMITTSLNYIYYNNLNYYLSFSNGYTNLIGDICEDFNITKKYFSKLKIKNNNTNKNSIEDFLSEKLYIYNYNTIKKIFNCLEHQSSVNLKYKNNKDDDKYYEITNIEYTACNNIFFNDLYKETCVENSKEIIDKEISIIDFKSNILDDDNICNNYILTSINFILDSKDFLNSLFNLHSTKKAILEIPMHIYNTINKNSTNYKICNSETKLVVNKLDELSNSNSDRLILLFIVILNIPKLFIQIFYDTQDKDSLIINHNISNFSNLLEIEKASLIIDIVLKDKSVTLNYYELFFNRINIIKSYITNINKDSNINKKLLCRLLSAFDNNITIDIKTRIFNIEGVNINKNFMYKTLENLKYNNELKTADNEHKKLIYSNKEAELCESMHNNFLNKTTRFINKNASENVFANEISKILKIEEAKEIIEDLQINSISNFSGLIDIRIKKNYTIDAKVINLLLYKISNNFINLIHLEIVYFIDYNHEKTDNSNNYTIKINIYYIDHFNKYIVDFISLIIKELKNIITIK